MRASVFLDIVHALVRSEDSHAPACVFTHMSIIACGMLIYTYIQIYMSHTHTHLPELLICSTSRLLNPTELQDLSNFCFISNLLEAITPEAYEPKPWEP